MLSFTIGVAGGLVIGAYVAQNYAVRASSVGLCRDHHADAYASISRLRALTSRWLTSVDPKRKEPFGKPWPAR